MSPDPPRTPKTTTAVDPRKCTGKYEVVKERFPENTRVTPPFATTMFHAKAQHYSIL
jgi:hypothetical protein